MLETVSINSAIIFDAEKDKTKVKLQAVEAKTIDKEMLNDVLEQTIPVYDGNKKEYMSRQKNIEER